MPYASQPVSDAIAKPDPSDPRSATFPKMVIGDRWRRWLSGLTTQLNTKVERVASVARSSLGAAIATTALPIGSVTPGLWAIYANLRVSRAGSVSGEVQLTIKHTASGVTQTEAGTNLTGNATTTREGKLFLVRPDNATVISYSTTYADGGGAVSLQYQLDMVVVQLVEKAVGADN